MLGKKVASFLASHSSSEHAVANSSVSSCVKIQGTSVADIHLLPRSCISIASHVTNETTIFTPTNAQFDFYLG
jgi:hypothetical protein